MSKDKTPSQAEILKDLSEKGGLSKVYNVEIGQSVNTNNLEAPIRDKLQERISSSNAAAKPPQ